MNQEMIDKIRLEERARTLAKASQDVQKMLKELELKNKPQESPSAAAVTPKKNKPPNKNTRGSQSLSNLNAGGQNKGNGGGAGGRGGGGNAGPQQGRGRGNTNFNHTQGKGRGQQVFHSVNRGDGGHHPNQHTNRGGHHPNQHTDKGGHHPNQHTNRGDQHPYQQMNRGQHPYNHAMNRGARNLAPGILSAPIQRPNYFPPAPLLQPSSQLPVFPPAYDEAVGIGPSRRPNSMDYGTPQQFGNQYQNPNLYSGNNFHNEGPHFIPSKVPPLMNLPTNEGKQQFADAANKPGFSSNLQGSSVNPKDNDCTLAPKDLIKELSNFRGFWSTVDRLSTSLRKQQKIILEVVKLHNGIFTKMNDGTTNEVLIELCPKIKMCNEYMELNGCQRQRCFGLHICQQYLIGQCAMPNCHFGHVWKSNHNNNVFKTFLIDTLPDKILHELMQKVVKGTLIPQICSSYNQKMCNAGNQCNSLHLCYQYVMSLGICPEGSQCPLNHKVHDPLCRVVFENYGISINESPRDILKMLADNIKNSSGNVSSSHQVSSHEKSGISDDAKKLDGSESSEEDSCIEENNTKESNEQKTKKSKKKKNKPNKEVIQDPKSKTSFAWQLEGDIEVPMICLLGVSGECKEVREGCKYLHAKGAFHWQFGIKNKWYNFHVYHSKILERKFRDVTCEEVALPRLDPKLINENMKSISSLLGSKTIKADFNSMTLNCDGAQNKYDIRQLTTPSSAICDSNHSTTFKWYFMNDDKVWQMYDVGSTCSVSSTDIEKAYQTLPLVPFLCKTHSFDYELDFTSMTQRNLRTKKERGLRRRPEPFVTSEVFAVKKIELPKYWDAMENNETYKLVKLNSSSEEFTEIRQIVQLTLPVCTIINIMRVQNDMLWRQFKNKEEELKLKYKDTFLNTQKLFHGIDEQHLSDICRDNLDWRIHDASTSKKFGQGTYFYNNAFAGSSSCTVDFMGNKKLLVATVIIGQIAKGDASMTRPPENPLMASLYDTTVDDVYCPSVFVKYNKQEYYPSYFVEFK